MPSRSRDTSTPQQAALGTSFPASIPSLWPARQSVPSPALGGFKSHRSLCLFPGHAVIVATAQSERSFEWYSGFKSQWQATGPVMMSSLGAPRDWARSGSFSVATTHSVTGESRCYFARNSQVQILSVALPSRTPWTKRGYVPLDTGSRLDSFSVTALIRWPSSWSLPSPQEPEVWVRIPAVECIDPP